MGWTTASQQQLLEEAEDEEERLKEELKKAKVRTTMTDVITSTVTDVGYRKSRSRKISSISGRERRKREL